MSHVLYLTDKYSKACLGYNKRINPRVGVTDDNMNYDTLYFKLYAGVRLNICIDRLLFGGNLYDIIANDFENDTAKTIISGGLTLFEFGYGIIKEKTFSLNTGLFVGELALQNNFIIVVSEKKKKKYIEKKELSIRAS